MTSDCEVVREAMSAAFDGEPPRPDVAGVTAHLAGCEECCRWREAVHVLNRRFRLQAAGDHAATDDLVRRARLALPGGRFPSPTAVRVALVLVALIQLAVTVPLVLFGHQDSLRDLGAFDIALSVGFLAAAMRPSRAVGLRAVVGSAALLLVASALVEIATGRTRLWQETPHLLTVAGWFLLRRLVGRGPGASRVPRVRPWPGWEGLAASLWEDTPGIRRLTAGDRRPDQRPDIRLTSAVRPEPLATSTQGRHWAVAGGPATDSYQETATA